MNNPLHATVRHLMELQSLEDRLELLGEKSTKAKLAEFESHIAALRAQVPTALLGRHDRFRAQGKRSVAEVRNGVCTGCHMRLAIGKQQQLRRLELLHTCESCGRVLYMIEATVPPVLPIAAKKSVPEALAA